jgi:hypothetical protein
VDACYWCERYAREKQHNTEHDYILPREYSDFGYGPCWNHRVQLWGRNTEVRKNCPTAYDSSEIERRK